MHDSTTKRKRRGQLRDRGQQPPPRLPKLNGADTELGNLIQGLETSRTGTCFEASRLLLSRIDGLPRVSRRHAVACTCASCHTTGAGRAGSTEHHGGVVLDPQDLGRKYLRENGGCVYIDLDHLELAIPEVLSARDHVAAWWAMLRLARAALVSADALLPEGQRLFALANNSDGRGNSYGGHLNFMVTRRCWDNVMDRRPHYLGFLASYQASSIVFAGQGKVGSENGRAHVSFQLSQRADFFETLIGTQTTYRRPLVNSRDEALCGSSDKVAARVHCIFYDTNLSQVALFLKVGVMQMILALVEAERVDARLALDDPLSAVFDWSHDPTLRATAPLADGRKVTAVELQLLFLEQLRRFHALDGFAGIVPEAGEILDLWEDTLALLAARDLPALAGRLDWALKLSLLQATLRQDADLTWRSPALKHLDHLYSSLDEDDGLFWACHRSGLTRQVVAEARIEHLTENPPENTRAWARAMLLRRAGDGIDDVDWDRIRFRSCGRSSDSAHAPLYRQLDLAAPLGLTRARVGALFENRALSLDELLDLLGADAPTPTRYSSYAWGSGSH